MQPLNFNEYNIIFEDNKHFYKVEPLKNTDLIKFGVYQSSSIHKLVFFKQTFTKKNWSLAFIFIIETLIKMGYINEHVLTIKFNWINQEIFTSVFKVNHRMLSNGIYLNCNLGTPKTVKVIFDLLDYFHISFNNLELVVKMAPSNESLVVKNYFKEKNIDLFQEFLRNSENLSPQIIKMVINNLNNFDKLFNKLYRSKESIFLFEDQQEFSNYCSQFIKVIKLKYFKNNVENQNKAIKCLEYLRKFYYVIYRSQN